MAPPSLPWPAGVSAGARAQRSVRCGRRPGCRSSCGPGVRRPASRATVGAWKHSTCSSRAARSWTGPARPDSGPRSASAATPSAVIRGDVSGLAAGRRIDATGHVVAPGFIDVHSHSGLMILAEPRHEPKVRQGVTTEVIGVDGNSYAPFRSRTDLLAFARLNAGLDGLPEDRLRLVVGGLLPAPIRPSCERQHGVPGGQLCAAHRCPGLGRRARGRTGTRPDARAAAGIDGGGCLRAVVGARLPTGRVRVHRRAGGADRCCRAAGRHLSHARAVCPGRRVPRPVPGGHRHRSSRWRSRPHHPLLSTGDRARTRPSR